MQNTKQGGVNPINLIINRVAEIFQDKIGFVVADGPELETDWNVFEALNFPPNHPAREMQDTFWIDKRHFNDKKGKEENFLLRTHTSSVQIRSIEKWVKDNKEKLDKQEFVKPIAIICPGRVYRNEATDATHEANFFQLECLYVSENASVGNLKYIIETFLSELFERKILIRMRTSFFPFVEPTMEIDMTCFKCGGSGCSICKKSGWIELGGSGMVHPNVLKNCGIDSEKYKGFAFGFGIDRIAMMLWGIEDIRYFYNGDMRLTSQF
jgi:phenylalanyl-tRNA synthetase alpha chain